MFLRLFANCPSGSVVHNLNRPPSGVLRNTAFGCNVQMIMGHRAHAGVAISVCAQAPAILGIVPAPFFVVSAYGVLTARTPASDFVIPALFTSSHVMFTMPPSAGCRLRNRDKKRPAAVPFSFPSFMSLFGGINDPSCYHQFTHMVFVCAAFSCPFCNSFHVLELCKQTCRHQQN